MTGPAARVAVLPVDEQSAARAAGLAAELGLPLLPTGAAPTAPAGGAELLLLVSDAGLALQQSGPGAPGPVRVDFGDPGMRHRRRGGQGELLGRAVGVGGGRRPRVLDATAGLGRDSFVLADLGCEVLACERHPLLARLLQDGLDRARASGDPWLAQAAQRIELWPADVRTLSDESRSGISVIYLDPMFPPRRKSAAVRKEMALFQRLLGEGNDDGAALLDWVLVQPVGRVVVKRPLRAATLGDRAPSHCIRGRAVRFDVYLSGKAAG